MLLGSKALGLVLSINFWMLLNPMFIERKVNHSTNTVKRWKWEWEYPEGASAKKRYVHKLGEEQPLKPEDKNA